MHTTPPRVRRTGLIGALNAEFDQQQHSPLPAWDCAHLAYPNAGALLSSIRHATPAHADATLHSLLREARRGDELAARLLLQAMLGVVARHTRTAFGRHLDAPESAAVAAMLEAIHTYPLRLRHRVAANLTMRALAALPAAPTSMEIPTQYVSALADDCGNTAAVANSPADLEAAGLIDWGLMHGILSLDEAQLLRLAHLREEAASSTVLAAEAGLTPTAWRQRHHRIVRRLAAAVRDRLAEPA